jgi:hypothetical protein
MPRMKRTPHVNAAAHARFMERMRDATPEQMRESLVQAGIVTKSGRFTAPYREFEALLTPIRPKPAAR